MEQVATDRSLPEPTEIVAAGAVRRRAAGGVVLEGLLALVEGQRQFADEFGLSLVRVFPRSHTLFEHGDVRQALRRMLRGQQLEGLERLFADLSGHQIALMSAIGEIARHAMDELEPQKFGEGAWPVLRAARAWRDYRDHWAALRENDLLRFERLVAAGFIPAYVRMREQEGGDDS